MLGSVLLVPGAAARAARMLVGSAVRSRARDAFATSLPALALLVIKAFAVT